MPSAWYLDAASCWVMNPAPGHKGCDRLHIFACDRVVSVLTCLLSLLACCSMTWTSLDPALRMRESRR